MAEGWARIRYYTAGAINKERNGHKKTKEPLSHSARGGGSYGPLEGRGWLIANVFHHSIESFSPELHFSPKLLHLHLVTHAHQVDVVKPIENHPRKQSVDDNLHDVRVLAKPFPKHRDYPYPKSEHDPDRPGERGQNTDYSQHPKNDAL